MQEKFHYQKEDLTILWQPKLCTHSGICVHGLGKVFNAQRRPWIDTDQGTREEIRQQVLRCPSGALSLVQPSAPPPSDSPVMD